MNINENVKYKMEFIYGNTHFECNEPKTFDKITREMCDAKLLGYHKLFYNATKMFEFIPFELMKVRLIPVND